MKQTYLQKTGFTLIEILMVVTLIGIFLLSLTNLDFSRLSTRQKAEIFANTFIGNIETIRNYAFQGRGIGSGLETPDTWSIEVSDTASGTFVTSYSGGIAGVYEPSSFVVEKGYQIKDLNCSNVAGNVVENISGTGTLRFQGDTISLAGCTNTSLKILEFTVMYNEYEHIIQVNTINGIIQER